MILLETTQSRHVFRSLSAILAIGSDDSMASHVAHLGLGNRQLGDVGGDARRASSRVIRGAADRRPGSFLEIDVGEALGPLWSRTMQHS